jgi:phage terminase large subunit-like protein
MAVQAGLPSRPTGVGEKAEFDAVKGVWVEGEYWFDQAAADKAVAFFADYLCFTKGEWAGRPFLLEPWQEDRIVRPLFGWKRLDDNTRRYLRCYVWVPRKNGKTELAAGIGLLLLVGDAEEGGEVYAIASNKDQAGIVFGQAGSMVGRSERLGEHLVVFKTSIYCPSLNAAFKPLTGKAGGKHGFNASGVIGDEIHEWTDGDLYQFIHDSQDARAQPLEFLISTAGKKGTYGDEVYEECVKIVEGTIDDPTTLVVIFAADSDDDWQDEKTWFKANPNLGVSKKLNKMRVNARRARLSPRLENHFKNYHLNLWTEQAVRWLPIDSVDDQGRSYGWNHCVGPVGWQDLEAKLRGKTCFGGVDLSATTDLSALCWWFPVQPGLEVAAVLARFFKPEDLIVAHGRRDKLPYDRWVVEKALIATPGNVIDYAFIREQIYRDAERFRIAYVGNKDRKPHEGGIAIDRWNATETAVKLEEEGLPVVKFGQGYASMTAPSKELERLVIGNGFHHGGHPVLKRHAEVVAVEEDPAGNIKPAKNKSTERIDGVVAAIMCLGLALAGHEPAPKDYQVMIF